MYKPDFKKRLQAVLSLDSHPGHIAAGFAVGVFISITPLLGVHTFLAIAVAIVFKLNKLAAITGSLINTPLTILPLLLMNYRLGEIVLGQHPRAVSFETFDWHQLQEYAEALLIGCSITGLAAALLSYTLVYHLVVRFQQSDQGLAELGRESVITGEALDQEPRENQP